MAERTSATVLTQTAQGPASATVDGRTVTQHSIKDLIEWDRYQAGKDAAARRSLGIRRVQVAPPGP